MGGTPALLKVSRSGGVFAFDAAGHYARIRGSLGIPPADAVHWACAAQAGADLFLTNDKRLVGKIIPGIQFIATLDSQFF